MNPLIAQGNPAFGKCFAEQSVWNIIVIPYFVFSDPSCKVISRSSPCSLANRFRDKRRPVGALPIPFEPITNCVHDKYRAIPKRPVMPLLVGFLPYLEKKRNSYLGSPPPTRARTLILYGRLCLLKLVSERVPIFFIDPRLFCRCCTIFSGSLWIFAQCFLVSILP